MALLLFILWALTNGIQADNRPTASTAGDGALHIIARVQGAESRCSQLAKDVNVYPLPSNLKNTNRQAPATSLALTMLNLFSVLLQVLTRSMPSTTMSFAL